MTVATVVARLEDILSSIEGVVAVRGGRPRDISPVDIPAFLIFTDPASNDYTQVGTSDMVATTRMYRLVLLVQTWPMGDEMEVEAACRPYIDRVNDAFMSRPGLDHPKGQNALASVQEALLLGDSGVANLELAGKRYAGVEFQLQVTEYLPRTFA